MDLQIGSTIGDCQVVSILGAGGLGNVYKVRNAISGQVEAMKALPLDVATEAGMADRLLREVKAASGLEHPNIAALHTAVQAGDKLLILMELVEGVTLEQRLKDGGPLTAPEAAHYMNQALSALEYAHAHSVIHGDIKPANLMVTPGGELKLMDFGIARGAADHKLAPTGATLGSSVYYMSPEQIQGEANLDGRSDLYSVGVSLYELVTGRRPFDADSQSAIMAAHLEKTPVPPIAVDPRLPQGLNDVILLSMAKDPNARFQTARAFRNALTSVVPAPAQAAAAAAAAAPVAAFAPAEAPRAIEPAKPAAKGGRRGLWMGIGAVAAVLAVVAAIEFGPWRGSRAAPPPETPSVPPVVTQAPAAVETPPEQPVATPAVETPSEQPVAAPAPQVPRSPARVAARPQTLPAGGPPAQQAATPAEQAPPPPVQGVPAPVAARPAESGPSRAELQAAREQFAMLNARAGSVQTSLQSLRRSQAASGLNLRADMQQASSMMDAYLKGATDAFNANDLAAAKSLMDKAEAQIDKLENFLGH